MVATLGTANRWAQNSCPRWNKNRTSRKLYRFGYRMIANRFFHSKEHQRLVKRYKSGETTLNTYLWPYAHPNFASWEESDDAEDYSLVSDPSGCVVKYATSYVAYKIFEETGAWPKKKTRIRLDAKNWMQFLAEAGYTTIVDKPVHTKHYVGVLREPTKYEFGLVVWFEADLPGGKFAVSTYVNKRYQRMTLSAEDCFWVEVDRPNRSVIQGFSKRPPKFRLSKLHIAKVALKGGLFHAIIYR